MRKRRDKMAGILNSKENIDAYLRGYAITQINYIIKMHEQEIENLVIMKNKIKALGITINSFE
jgi:hypothetical protein